MAYATGQTPQIGDRVKFITWAGFTEATVDRIGHFGLIRAGGIWNFAWTVGLVERPQFAEVFGDVLDRELLAAKKEDLHQMTQVIQEVKVDVKDGSSTQEGATMMNMGPGVNTVILSGKVDPDTDLDAGDLVRLQMFRNLEVLIPNGYLSSDIDWGDEVLVTGHLEQMDHEGGKIVVIADQVVKLG